MIPTPPPSVPRVPLLPTSLPRPRRRPPVAAILVLIAAVGLLAGCVGFTAPVPGDPDTRVDLTPYVGNWRTDDGSGQIVHLVQAFPNTLEGTLVSPGMDDPEGREKYWINLADVGERTVASIESTGDSDMMGYGQPLWLVVAVEWVDSDTLRLRGLDPAAMEAVVEAGDLAAERLSRSDGMVGGPPAFAVDSNDLRAYFMDHPEAFGAVDTVTLVRDSPQAGDGYPGPYPGYGDSEMPWPTPGMYNDESAYATPTAWPVGAGDGAGGGGSPAGESDRLAALDGLLLGLLAILVVGLIAFAAIRYVRRRAAAAATAEAVTPAGWEAEWRMEDGAGRDGAGATLGRLFWPGLLVLAVALGPALYATALLHGLAFPGGGLGIGPGTQALMHGFSPYLLVFSLGALIGAAEVISTYPTFSVEALGTRWAVVLVLLNALATALVFSTATAVATGLAHPLLRALAVAIGFAILMRTRFVLARDLRGPEGGDGVSLDFGWLYARFQQLCHQRIERDLLGHPRYAVERLLSVWPDEEALDRAAADAIASRDPEQSNALRADLEAVRTEDLGPGIRRARTAWFIAKTGGPAHVRFLIEHSDPPTAGMGHGTSPE